MTDAISIVVVDDHPLYRSGVIRTLAEDGGFEVKGEGASAEDAVRLAGELKPQMILLDISMPGGGLTALGTIASQHPGTTPVILTVSEADDDIIRAMELGARGYVPKGVGADELVGIVRGVHAGEVYVSPGLAGRLLARLRQREEQRAAPDAFATLTQREEQILRHVAAGLSNKEIGRKLDLQEKTVKHYMTNILQKLNVRNRVEAAMKANEVFEAARRA